jgi:N-formylglutamate deformylase
MARLIPMSPTELLPRNYRLELPLLPRPQAEPGIIFHIPHSSTTISPEDRAGIFLDDRALNRELLRMTDRYVQDILRPVYGPRDSFVLFPWSRLVVDVERFRDDADEPMAGRGMGAVYARTSDGHPLRAVSPDGVPVGREELLLRHYDPHHHLLEKTVSHSLMGQGAALLLDCHSFPSRPLPCDLVQARHRPEVCIGTDGFHTPLWLVDTLVHAFRQEGLSVALNRPYTGTLVPLGYWKKDPRVLSAMIELRRDLYMDETTGEPWNLAAMTRVMGRVVDAVRDAFAGLQSPPASGWSREGTEESEVHPDPEASGQETGDSESSSGQERRKARVRHLGSTRPDDPIYQEGFTVFTGRKAW